MEETSLTFATVLGEINKLLARFGGGRLPRSNFVFSAFPTSVAAYYLEVEASRDTGVAIAGAVIGGGRWIKIKSTKDVIYATVYSLADLESVETTFAFGEREEVESLVSTFIFKNERFRYAAPRNSRNIFSLLSLTRVAQSALARRR